MSDAVDKLSIQITSEADEAASAVERLVKNMRSLARIMKRLESGSTGIKGVAQSAKDIADGVSKSSDKTTSGMKKTTKATNEAKKATESFKKVADGIKADNMKSFEKSTKDAKDSLKQATKEAEKLKEATSKVKPQAEAPKEISREEREKRLKEIFGDTKKDSAKASQQAEIPKEIDRAEREKRLKEIFGEGAKTYSDTSAKIRREMVDSYKNGNPNGYVKASEALAQSSKQVAQSNLASEIRKVKTAMAESPEAANQLSRSLERLRRAYASVAPEASNASASISKMKPNSASSALANFGDKLKRIPWGVAHAGASLFKKTISGVGQATKFSGGFIRGFMGTIARVPAGFLRGMANFATFGLIGKGAREGQSAIDGLTSSVGFGLKGIMKYVLGFRTLFYLVRAIRKAIAEGFVNLASVNEKTNESLSMLKSRLTQVKNGLATAFAPVLNAVAPMVNKLIGILMDGINAVAQFFAALTGQSTWQRAVYKMQDFSAGADSAGDSASNANDKAKELQKTLLSFDKINKLNDNDSSSGSGGGGGGGGGGGAAGAGMFTTETVSTGISDFANMVKKAWAESDFTEVGEVIGTKLKNALDGIPWEEKIKPMARKIGKSIGTLINGFVSVEGLPETLGKTVSQALNTFMEGLNSFLETVKWQKVGEFVTKSIGSALDNFDYKLAASTTSNLAIAIQDFVAGCISGVNWREMPKKIVEKVKEFLSGIKWKEELASLGNLAGTILAAVWDLTAGLAEVIGDVGKAIGKYFKEKMDEAGYEDDKTLAENGKAIVKGIFKGIVDFFDDIVSWIDKNMFQPFIAGFKKAFGVDKIETAMNGFSAVTDWFGKLFGGDETGQNHEVTASVNLDANPTNDYKKYVIGNGKDTGYQNIKDGKATKGINASKGNLWDSVVNAWNKFSGKPKDATVNVKTKGKIDPLKTAANAWAKFKEGKMTKKPKLEQKTSGTSGWKTLVDRWNLFSKKESQNTKSAKLNTNKGGNSSPAEYQNVYNAMNKGRGERTLKMTVGLSESSRNLLRAWSNAEDNPNSGTLRKLANTSGPSPAIGGVFYNGRLSLNIPQYAVGGSPTHGSVFVAGESGAEVVGHLNGRTEVLNRSQMAAVMYSAVLRGMSQALATSGNSQQVVVIEPNAQGIFRVVQKEANNYTNMTGRPAFNM